MSSEIPYNMPVLELDTDDEQAMKVFKALASETRLRILKFLGSGPHNVSTIAEELDLPLSTANLHLSVLEDAGLLFTDWRPGTRGTQKVCARAFSTITVPFRSTDSHIYRTMDVSMPIGAYADCQVAPTCGLHSETNIISYLDRPSAFYEPEHIYAQRLWFHHGYVEYRFPNRMPPQTTPESLHLSFEACSEAVTHHYNWPSDISVWINGVELGVWTSPADFGGERGMLTPEWVNVDSSQYGLLKVWRVDNMGTFIDGTQVSDVSLSELYVTENDFISVRIGVRPDARHVGGINIFGKKYGNHPQDIVLTIHYV
ncbi:helix-turn-helix domain-containing protein [Phototrophicus methaneseepsis]|uniref:Helix-turn-helix domain-containing protein n=1 Tax=Phototrophicus methaneseepsis TaxID=2710758 RepID=A0A7S8E7Y5_9CHLR|nr:helix-turn-helix domain-containing protein [Phototrophicus methaneseepsis]QPC82026.1 helix-turn-helix domain-containing protein [Phototrophicus methaneseepsis]